MPNLAEIIRKGLHKDEEGIIPDLKDAGMPASGLDRMAAVIAAFASKLLEILVPFYGADSEQGKRIMRARKTISPITQGVTIEDIGAVLKMLEGVFTGPGALPGGMGHMMEGMMRPTTGPSPLPPIPPEEERREGPASTPPGIRTRPGLGEILGERRV